MLALKFKPHVARGNFPFSELRMPFQLMPKVKAAMPCVEKAPLSTVAMVAFNLLGNPKNRTLSFRYII